MTYFIGDNVPLKFTCEEDGSPVTPTVAKVTICKPDASLTDEADATISADEVSYSVPTTVTSLAGNYKAYFNLTISGLERTHLIVFTVHGNP